MPADDRDQKFERALAKHLRGDSATACPDAETLAAYHERSLSLEEMAHWKQHISSCATCQETLALVETAEKQLAEDWENSEMPVLAVAAQPPAAMRSLAAPGEEGPREETSATTSPAAVEIARRRRRPALLRWAIPVGALAAGVLVWIGIHEQRVLTRQSEGVQIAQNKPASPPEQKLNDTLKMAQPPLERDDRRMERNEKDTRERLESPGAVSQLASPAVPTAKPHADTRDAEEPKKEVGGRTSDALAYTYNAAPPPPPTAARVSQQPKAPSPTTESVEASAAAPTAASEPSPKATDSVTGGAVGGAAGAVELKSQERAGKEKALGKQQAANDLDTTNAMMMKQGMSGKKTTSMYALAPLPAVILTPDHRVWWRLAASGGTLELTTDGGKTWKVVNVGVDAQLIGGSAPSSKICWIAGKAGALLMTSDRGAHWKALTTPMSGDLGGVRATDEKRASIWDAARQQSFETTDGGATWKPAAP